MPSWHLLPLPAIALTCFISVGAQENTLFVPTTDTVEGRYRFSVTVPTRCAATASAAMYRKGGDGAEDELWRRTLSNNPEWWRVDSRSGWVVTFGSHCTYALEHAVIVYDSAGRTVVDYRVDDLFTPEERRRMGWMEFGDKPRDLADDERTGSDIFSASKVVFADDGVWLTHNRVERTVLLIRR